MQVRAPASATLILALNTLARRGPASLHTGCKLGVSAWTFAAMQFPRLMEVLAGTRRAAAAHAGEAPSVQCGAEN